MARRLKRRIHDALDAHPSKIARVIGDTDVGMGPRANRLDELSVLVSQMRDQLGVYITHLRSLAQSGAGVANLLKKFYEGHPNEMSATLFQQAHTSFETESSSVHDELLERCVIPLRLYCALCAEFEERIAQNRVLQVEFDKNKAEFEKAASAVAKRHKRSASISTAFQKEQKTLSESEFRLSQNQAAISADFADFFNQRGSFMDGLFRAMLDEQQRLFHSGYEALSASRITPIVSQTPSTDITGSKMTLEQVLSDIVGLQYFRKYCWKIHTVEHVDFYLECRSILSPETGDVARYNAALCVWEKYVRNDSEAEVNLGDESKQGIRHSIQELEKSMSAVASLDSVRAFRKGLEEIFELMRKDILPRFLLSDIYSEYRALERKMYDYNAFLSLAREARGKMLTRSSSRTHISALERSGDLENSSLRELVKEYWNPGKSETETPDEN